MNNLNVFGYGYSYWKRLRNISCNIGQFFRNCKYACQRATRGYCDQDIWNLDSYYSELFYQTLRHLSETTMSRPCTSEFKDKYDGDKLIVDGHDLWKQYLNEMAEHFLNTQEWNEDVPINQQITAAFDKMQQHIIDTKEYEEQDEHFGKLYSVEEIYDDKGAYNKAHQEWWDLEVKASKFREDEKNKAFDMMKKVFFSLWD